MADSHFMPFKFDYSKTESLAAGDVVRSEVMSAGGHQWRIECYPRGYDEADEGEYLSIYLELVSKSNDVKAIFEAFLIDNTGAPSGSHEHRCQQVYPPKEGSAWGWTQFLKRSELEPKYVVDGWLTIMCGVIVVLDGDETLTVPPADLGSHLGGLLDSGDGSNVSFVVGGKTLAAHRSVLAVRSPVFKAELFGSMAESTMSSITVTVQGIQSRIFELLLRFIYTDALPEDDELGDTAVEVHEQLLAAADRYAIERLKLVCAKKLWENVSVDTVASSLACAAKHNCRQLKDKCIAFFAEEKNFKDAILTDGFVQLVQKYPSIVAELREKAKK